MLQTSVNTPPEKLIQAILIKLSESHTKKKDIKVGWELDGRKQIKKKSNQNKGKYWGMNLIVMHYTHV